MKKFIVFTCALIMPSVSWGLTLQQSLYHSLHTNPKIKEAEANLGTFKEVYTQAKGDFLPTVDLNASSTNQRQTFDNSTSTSIHPKALGLSFSQTLFAGGKVVEASAVARNNYMAAKASRDVVVQNSLLSVATAYVALLRELDVLKLQTSQVELLQKQLEATKSQFKLGDATKTDVKQAEARLALSKAEKVQANGDLRSAKANLKNLLGTSINIDETSWPAPLQNLPQNIDDIYADAMANHPQIVAALGTLASKKHSIKQARSAHFPEITANAAVTHNNDTTLGDYDDRTISINLSLPLFKGGKTLSSVREAKFNEVKAKESYDQARRDVETELTDAFAAYEAAKASLLSYEQAEEATELATKGVEKEKELGERSTLELLDSRQELLEARVNVARGKYSEVVAAYRILAAVGWLTDVVEETESMMLAESEE